MTIIHYISLGYDCSPAAALRELNLRDEALPFDWVVSNLQIIHDCIEDNFANYHCHLQFNALRSRLIDKYGFQFPHDYPFNANVYEDAHVGEGVFEEEVQKIIIDNSANYHLYDDARVGEGVFEEEVQKKIIDNWANYHPLVLEKYARRIERMYNYLRDEKPIIVLCRGYDLQNITEFIRYIGSKFNKRNIYFVVSSKYKYISQQIITCDTEANGTWNEANIWQEGINAIKISNNL